MTWWVVNVSLPYQPVKVKKTTILNGMIDLTDAISSGIQKGIAIGIFEHFFEQKRLTKDSFKYLMMFQPQRKKKALGLDAIFLECFLKYNVIEEYKDGFLNLFTYLRLSEKGHNMLNEINDAPVASFNGGAFSKGLPLIREVK